MTQQQRPTQRSANKIAFLAIAADNLSPQAAQGEYDALNGLCNEDQMQRSPDYAQSWLQTKHYAA